MKDKKISIAIGKSGSGKSFLVNHLIADKRRLVVFDTMAEYEDVVTFADKRRFLEFWRKHHKGSFRIAYQPERNPAFEIDEIAELVYLCGDCCFVVEEVTAYTNPNYISDQLAHCIQRGRHKNIEIIATTQRPYGLHRLLTSQCANIYSFNTNEPRDVAYLRDLLGAAMEAKLKELQKYQFVHWVDGSDELTITQVGKGTNHEDSKKVNEPVGSVSAGSDGLSAKTEPGDCGDYADAGELDD